MSSLSVDDSKKKKSITLVPLKSGALKLQGKSPSQRKLEFQASKGKNVSSDVLASRAGTSSFEIKSLADRRSFSKVQLGQKSVILDEVESKDKSGSEWSESEEYNVFKQRLDMKKIACDFY